MGRVEEVKIHQHQLPFTDLPKRFKHQIHPKRFTGAVNFLTHISGHATEFQGAQIFEGNESRWPALTVSRTVLEEIEVVAPLLVHETQETLKNDPSFHDSRPWENGLHVLLERWIQNGGCGLNHSANVVGLLTGIGVPIKHAELFVEQVLRLLLHTELRRRERTVGKFLGLVKEAFCRNGIQNPDRV